MKTRILAQGFMFAFILICNGQIKDDAVLFTVDETPVLASEFLKVYNKNLDLVKDDSQKDVDEYLKLFVNYKLKLREAMALGFDQSPKYLREFGNYKKQLTKNYLTDHEVTDALVREAYERLSYDVQVKHVLVRLSEHEKDTAEAFARILKLRDRFVNENFSALQEEALNSEDVIAEDLGYFSGFKMVYAFENVAFNTKVGEVSQPFRTSFGYHVLKVLDKRRSRGQVTVGHIMIVHNQKDPKIDPEARIKELYKLLEQGKAFESIAKQFSDDKGSAKNGGKLPAFQGGQLRSAHFEDRAFNLSEIGEISEPFRTDYGWHIVKLYGKKPLADFEDMKFELENKVKRDDRSKLINTSMVKNLKDKYVIDESKADLLYFESIMGEAYSSSNWRVPQDLNRNKPFLKIEDKLYTYGDFADHLFKMQRRPIARGAVKRIIPDLYADFLDTSILAYHEENLEYENPEFAQILDEYRSGLLLFDLMESKIWNAVKNDTLGLKDFYRRHMADYKWEERIEAVVATCPLERDMHVVKDLLVKGMSLDSISMKVNTKDSQNVIFTSGLMAKSHQALPPKFEFKTGISKVHVYNDAYNVIQVKEILPETEKTFQEARGRVISDFQNEVETRWVNGLRDKYKVEIDGDVLTELKSIIYSN
jgi:peptidyl-prolyl cis-trans isomerase SurA